MVRVVLPEACVCDELPHRPEEQAALATVLAEQYPHGAPRHAYLVKLRQPVPWVTAGGYTIHLVVRHYAADELELVA